MDVEAQVLAHIDENFDAYLEKIKRYLSVPGISQTGEGIRESAALTLDQINELTNSGGRIVETQGNPVVLARTDSSSDDAKTLLLYCFYDVVPANPADWACPPFDPTVLDAKQIGLPEEWGSVLCGRGTTDHRGPFIAALMAFHSLQAVSGSLPVNVTYAIEGEEEIGSPSLRGFIDSHQDELKGADGFWFPRTSRETEGGPLVVHRGYKGQTWLNLTIKGGEWGGTRDARDIWSANVAWVDAPALRLIHALDSLTDDDYRIAIDGFWDHVRPINEAEQREIQELEDDFDEAAIKQSLKIAQFKGGADGRDLLSRYIMEPQLNISLGVWPGLPGEEEYTKGVVDGSLRTELLMRARARVDFRLTPDLEPDLVSELVRAHLDRRGFHEIEISPARGGYSWSRTEPNSSIYRALGRACKSRDIKPHIWPTMPSTAPFDLFNRSPLQIPIIIFGAAHGARWHEANEYVSVEGLREYMKFTASWLLAWADEPND
jgi:acetylornithine deacetylase/succinyl-diaminopimelate desuccinylase-like protein